MTGKYQFNLATLYTSSDYTSGINRVQEESKMDDVDDSSLEECGGVDWIMYKDRPEWKDVIPLQQNDIDQPVVQIAYSDKFRDVFDYFRAVLAKDERSERALQLTKDAAMMNPSNYTVWYFRRILLKELKKNLYDELAYIEEVIEDSPKNYQVWHHRRVLVEWLRDPSLEKAMTEKILDMDAKNYHAWQHRQWVLQEFGLWNGELNYVDRLLEEDIRNNSAWNQRYFVISHTTGYTEAVLDSEIKYTLRSIETVSQNESSWNYLRGILKEHGLCKFSNVWDFCERLYDSGCRSCYLLAFMIDCLEEKLQNETGSKDSVLQRALQLANLLADEHDKIRCEYWKFIARNLGQQYGMNTAPNENSIN